MTISLSSTAGRNWEAQFIFLKMADFRGPASESQRVMQLQKRRERAQEEIEFKRKKLADELKLDKARRDSLVSFQFGSEMNLT